MSLTNRDKELRTFGLSLGLGLMIISTVLRLKSRSYFYLPPLALLVVFLAFLKPEALRLIKNLLEKIGRIITAFLTWILLVIAFYLIVTPLGLIARLFRKRFLKLRFEDISSYFEKRERGKVDRRSYERQF